MLVQSVLIIGGSLLTRVILKAMGYPHEMASHWNLPIFLRDWSLILLVIPLGWGFISIRAEEHSAWWTQRTTLISGVLLLALLGLMILLALFSASRPPYSVIRFLDR